MIERRGSKNFVDRLLRKDECGERSRPIPRGVSLLIGPRARVPFGSVLPRPVMGLIIRAAGNGAKKKRMK